MAPPLTPLSSSLPLPLPSFRLTQVFDRYSILEILAGDVCFVNSFRSILPVVPKRVEV